MRHNKSSKYWKTGEYTEEEDIYPYRVLSGSEGLSIDMRLSEKDIDYVCSGPVQSFKILLHPAGKLWKQTNESGCKSTDFHSCIFYFRRWNSATWKILLSNSAGSRCCICRSSKYYEHHSELDRKLQ